MTAENSQGQGRHDMIVHSRHRQRSDHKSTVADNWQLYDGRSVL